MRKEEGIPTHKKLGFLQDNGSYVDLDGKPIPEDWIMFRKRVILNGRITKAWFRHPDSLPEGLFPKKKDRS